MTRNTVLTQVELAKLKAEQHSEIKIQDCKTHFAISIYHSDKYQTTVYMTLGEFNSFAKLCAGMDVLS